MLLIGDARCRREANYVGYVCFAGRGGWHDSLMRNWVYLTAALLALQAVPAHAERDPVSGAPIKPDKHRMTPSPITDRFAVEGIFFNPAVSTVLRVDGQSP